MKIVMLETESLGFDIDLSMFHEIGDVVTYDRTTALEAGDRVKDADIIVVNKVPMNEMTLGTAGNLKMIALTATGTNNVDFSYTNARGITVANVKGYSTYSVVQHTFALLFYVYEKLAYYDEYVKSEAYAKSPIFSYFDKTFHELHNKTWGIIGLGEIGRGVAKTAETFGCQIIYYSTSGKNSTPDYKRVTLEELLKTSDIISIHAPLNADTDCLIGENELGQMKKSAVLINVGRGRIIDEKALYDALMQNKIAGAGLDVLSEEPISLDNPLIHIKDSSKLIITPHIAWATVEARTRCVFEVYENIKAYMDGKERNIVK